MNQSSSSSITHNHKSSPAWPKENLMKNKQQLKQSCRNPFQDLNNGGNASSVSSVEAPKGCLRFFLSHTSSSTKTHCSNRDNNHGPVRGKLVSTPKSAPNMRQPKEALSKRFIFHRPTSQKLEKVKKNPPKSGRKPCSRDVSSSKISSALDSNGIAENKLDPASRELKRAVVYGDGSNLTPLSKVASGSGLNLATDGKVINEDDEKSKNNSNANTDSSSNSKTPPVQASVSPEIQCGSSMVTTTAKTITPVCYGAGFVMSGVTDKRKCRPRGILTVGEAKQLDCFNSDDETGQENDLGLVNDSSNSMLPLPSEALMHWLSSPCNEEDGDHQHNSENQFCGFSRLEDCAVQNPLASPSPGNAVCSPNLCDTSTEKLIPSSNCRKKELSSALLSPSRGFMGAPLYDKAAVLCPEEERKNYSDFAEEKSPFSRDSLSSGNVIQTPQSDSTSERQGGISWLNVDGNRKNYNIDIELNSTAERIQMASLSPKSHVDIWDPAASSFQFDCLTTPSNSVDLSHFQKVLDDQASWFSNSTMENISQSQMRISWREGLVSRTFEIDEFDSCRCFSDAEDDADVCNYNSLNSDCSPELDVNLANEPISTTDSRSIAHVCNYNCLKSHCSPELNVDLANEPSSTTDSGSTAHAKSEPGSDRKVKEELPLQVPCSCAESISTDGCGLVRSEDSDWTACYKNHLFQ